MGLQSSPNIIILIQQLCTRCSLHAFTENHLNHQFDQIPTRTTTFRIRQKRSYSK
jgi:siroheme synthase